MKELNDLIQEIVDFGLLVSHNHNTADTNFQNACELFGGYLDWRYAEVKQSLDSGASIEIMHISNNEFNKLDELITSSRGTASACIEWARNLYQYCTELQRNKMVAA